MLFFLAERFFSKCIIDDGTGSLKTLQSLLVVHMMKTYILNVRYGALSDLSSVCYVILNDAIYSLTFYIQATLDLCYTLGNTILLSTPGPLNTLLPFSELPLSPVLGILPYFSPLP